MLTLATKLTLSRILLAALAVLCLYARTWPFPLLAILAFLAGIATDVLDGWVARRRGEVSPVGMFLDPLLDKVLVLSLLIALTEFQIFPAWMVILTLFRELSVSAYRELALSRGVDVPAIRSGKLKTALQFLAILLGLTAIAAVRYSGDVLGTGILDGTSNTFANVAGITAFLIAYWVLLLSILVGYYGMVRLFRQSWRRVTAPVVSAP